MWVRLPPGAPFIITTKKKNNRARGNAKSAKKRFALEKRKTEDVYDNGIRRDNFSRSNFHSCIQDACKNPNDYYPNSDFRGTDIANFAHRICNRHFKDPEREALSALVDVCRRTKLLDKSQADDYVEGLINLAAWSKFWINDPAEWEPKTKNASRQFSSLLKYLLCKYDVPKFMNKIWYNNPNGRADSYQEWFVNLGAGENIRKQNFLPISLTKKMAHHFVEAPDGLEVHEAIRWGQVLAEGGNERVAKAVLATPLGRGFTNDEFWISVIRFYIENPMLDTYQYGPLYDFIQDQKYSDRGHVYVDNELVHLGPPQPNFSMHRRNPNVLLRSVEGWHRNIRREQTRYGGVREHCKWDSCGIAGMLKKGKDEAIEISEILNSKELYADGESMKHCVGSYVQSCKAHRIAIFSLRRINKAGIYRMATISVNIQNRLIGEARKSCNRPVRQGDLGHIREWAGKSDLQLSSWLS